MPFSYSLTLAALFLSLPSSVIGAEYSAITCPNKLGSITEFWKQKVFDIGREWTPYLIHSIEYFCLRSHTESTLPGISCYCEGPNLFCPGRPEGLYLYGHYRWFRQANLMCSESCRCPGDKRSMDQKLVGPNQEQVPDLLWDRLRISGNQQSSSKSSEGRFGSSTIQRPSDFWGLRETFERTRSQCGWEDCTSPSSCNLLRAIEGCDRLVCKVWERTPGFYNDLGACFIPGSSMLGEISNLGGRSIDQSPCACNATYISHQCCETVDGMVWEASEAKLGELPM